MAKPVEVDDEYVKEIEKARRQLRALILNNNCAPLMLRLAWHDAATYNKKSGTGGPNGSIRTEQELNYAANKGLRKAVQLCEDVKAELKRVSYADLYQLAGVVAIEVTGGPEIDFVPGRKDSFEPSKDDLLPDANLEAPSHLREAFVRMGLSDRDIVALSGGHALGEARKDRSDSEAKRTSGPLKFDNSYFEELLEEKLFRLPTDKALTKDEEFKALVRQYKEDEKAFFKDYATSHKKLSELGYTVKNGSKVQHEKLNMPVIGIVMVSSAAIVGYLLKRKINRRKTFESQN